MRITFLGFGLIGGSVARALSARHADARMVAWSPTGMGVQAAVEDGVLAERATDVATAVAGSDIVVLAAPPLASLDLLRGFAGPLRAALPPDAALTDVVSTKLSFVAIADAAGLPFVGGHPMAGRETTGYGAADADLFVDRPWVVVPAVAARPRDVERVEWLATSVGARPVHASATDHDAAVAAISHLPLALSAALVEAVVGGPGGEPRSDWALARLLAASGWRDMTRLARGDVDMGAGIAATNSVALAARLRDVRAVLDGWIVDLDSLAGSAGGTHGVDAIAARLRNARARLDEE